MDWGFLFFRCQQYYSENDAACIKYRLKRHVFELYMLGQKSIERDEFSGLDTEAMCLMASKEALSRLFIAALHAYAADSG